jgi:Family of unknown function (DUF6529)
MSRRGESDVVTTAIPMIAPKTSTPKPIIPSPISPIPQPRQPLPDSSAGSEPTSVIPVARRHRAAPPPSDGIGSFPSQSELVSPPTAPTRIAVLLIAVAVGTLVSVGLGVYGRLHQPTFAGLSVAGFSSGGAAKSWLASAAFALVVIQLLSAVLMYRTTTSWVAPVHRWVGRVAVLATVPVAVHCLYALGFQLGSPRVLAHSLAGCFVYGVFVAKMLVLPQPTAPRWSIPVLGGVLFTALTAVWLTSSLWFFSTSGIVF